MKCFLCIAFSLLIPAQILSADLRIGMIGLDTSHVIEFTRRFNDANDKNYIPGGKVVAAFKGGSPDIQSSSSRVEGYTKQLQEKYGVKIVEGGTDKSYGIQVARLAGVPKPVLERAKEILRNLEESELTPEGKVRQTSRHRAEREKLKDLAPPPQMDLFG